MRTTQTRNGSERERRRHLELDLPAPRYDEASGRSPTRQVPDADADAERIGIGTRRVLLAAR
jgi:hypothetical protein